MKSKKLFLIKLLSSCLLIFFVLSISSCGDSSDQREMDLHDELTKTAIAASSPIPGIYNGTAAITKNAGGLYGNDPCVSNGEVTLTINTDNSVLLTTMGPDIMAPNCKDTGDKVSDRVFGTYNAKDRNFVFTSCDVDETTESFAAVNNNAIEGTIVCYYKKDVMVKIDYHVKFTQ